MLTATVTTRIFHIGWRDEIGTAFAIDRNNRQYLITASHVVEGVEDDDVIEIRHDNLWKHYRVKLIGKSEDWLDITVLSVATQLAPLFPLEATTDGLTQTRQVYFVGFPFGLTWDTRVFTDHQFPTPIVKAGIFSGAVGDNSLLLIDGHGNRGFSGGPVIFQPFDSQPNYLRVAGVVSRGPNTIEPIVNECRQAILDENNMAVGYSKYYSGFVIAVNIKHAIELIDAKPVGFPLSDDHPP